MNNADNETEEIIAGLSQTQSLIDDVMKESQALSHVLTQSESDRLQAEFFAKIIACLEEGSVESLIRAKEGFSSYIDSLIAQKIEGE